MLLQPSFLRGPLQTTSNTLSVPVGVAWTPDKLLPVRIESLGPVLDQSIRVNQQHALTANSFRPFQQCLTRVGYLSFMLYEL